MRGALRTVHIMTTLDNLFSELGGPANVGRLIGVSTEHASTMRRRRSVPVRYWPKLIEGARIQGVQTVNHQSLVEIHTAEEILRLSRKSGS